MESARNLKNGGYIEVEFTETLKVSMSLKKAIRDLDDLETVRTVINSYSVDLVATEEELLHGMRQTHGNGKRSLQFARFLLILLYLISCMNT